MLSRAEVAQLLDRLEAIFPTIPVLERAGGRLLIEVWCNLSDYETKN
jgi:hypothetical protein